MVFSTVSGVPVQFSKYLISAGASQGTALGTEEEAKTTGVSRRETRLLPRPLGGAAGEASGCRKGRTQGTPVELRTVSFPSCVAPSLPSSPPPFFFSFCFFYFFLLFLKGTVSGLFPHAPGRLSAACTTSPSLLFLPHIFDELASATSTAFGMVSIVRVVTRRKVAFVLIMRTVSLGVRAGGKNEGKGIWDRRPARVLRGEVLRVLQRGGR